MSSGFVMILGDNELTCEATMPMLGGTATRGWRGRLTCVNKQCS